MTLTVGKKDGNTFVKTKEVEVGEAIQMEINPIYIDTTFLVGNKKIAYLMYNSFRSGPSGYDDKTYDNQLQSVFAEFAAQNPDEFILDLRYNSGGVITSAQLLATMLAPQNALGQTFCKLIYNESLNKTVEYTLDKSVIGNGQNLGLNRLYILTERNTASSSELIINGLRPYFKDNLILVGNTTEGKNVGSNEFSDKTSHSWVLHPITCLVTNSEKFSDYTDGFTPDYPIDETYYDGDLGTLGETNEYMLSQTLDLILAGNVSKSLKSAENSLLRIVPQPPQAFSGILIP
ncbi:MAG: S41 family peptidase [Massilibacteroides sp.]|nr:S41 family peptidase [Massilibacteroides sp.]